MNDDARTVNSINRTRMRQVLDFPGKRDAVGVRATSLFVQPFRRIDTSYFIPLFPPLKKKTEQIASFHSYHLKNVSLRYFFSSNNLKFVYIPYAFSHLVFCMHIWSIHLRPTDWNADNNKNRLNVVFRARATLSPRQFIFSFSRSLDIRQDRGTARSRYPTCGKIPFNYPDCCI